MKRFLSFLMVAGLVLGLASCTKNEEDVTPGVGPNFPTEAVNGVVMAGLPFEMTVSPTPNTSWTISIDESQYFSLSETTLLYSVSGSANQDAVFAVYAAGEDPEETQTCAVKLTMAGESRVIANLTRFSAGDRQWTVYAAKLADSYDEATRNIYAKDEEGNIIYDESTPATEINLYDESYFLGEKWGEIDPQNSVKVISAVNWTFEEIPGWLWIRNGINNFESGAAGVTELRLSVFDYDFLPFDDGSCTLKAIEYVETGTPATLGTLNVNYEGCGGIIDVSRLNETMLFNMMGGMYNTNWNGWGDPDETYFIMSAPYGSEIFFVAENAAGELSTENTWIYFEDGDVEWEDSFKECGLAQLYAHVFCDPNADETRTAYLIAIPRNGVPEGFNRESVVENGKIADAYKGYIATTITQLANVPGGDDAYVKWAWGDDELGEYTRSDFAKLETIRPMDNTDERTMYFTGEWATAPVAYAVEYKNLEAFSVAALDVIDYATVEIYGATGPYETEQLSPEWVKWVEEDGLVTIKPNYDFEADKWNVEKPEYFTAFFLLKNDAGKIITWIMFTLEPVHYDPSAVTPRDVIAGASCDKGSVELFTLNDGEPGYDKVYAGVPQYKLEMINTASVSFETVPSGSHNVWDLETDAPHNEWFQRMGNTFVVETDDDNVALTFRVVFTNSTGSPVAVLFVDYLYGDPVAPAGGVFADARGVDMMGNDKGSATLTELKAGDHGYDPDTNGNQYLLEVKDTNFVQFGTFPAGINDFWSDGEEVEYQAGILMFFPSDNEAEFDVIFKKNYESIALIHVHYTNSEGGGSDKTDIPFALDESSIQNGAIVRRTTTADEWYTPYAGDAEQWTLIVNRDDAKDDGVTFISFPSVEEEPTVIGDYNYFELNPQGYNMSVMLLGDAYGEVQSAEYDVFFYNEWKEVAYRLHVRFNMGNDSNQPGGGEDEPTELFALAEGNTADIILRETTENDSWYRSALDYEQWTLIVKGSDVVMFSALPNLEGLMVLEDQDNEKGYFQVEEQGVTKIVTLAGDDWDAGSTTYTVHFYDEYDTAYCRLHVEWSK